jgi:hypothetical protein
MKNRILLLIFSVFFVISCTSDFDEINERTDALTAADVSAKYFVTNVQTGIYAPNRYPYWRGPVIHVDRYSGHTTFGFKACWWSDGLGYTYSAGYTGAVYDWQAGTNGTLTAFTNFVKTGGTLENEQYYAIALILKGLYYQRYTDTFGMVPYSEASDPDIVTPKLDDQKTIYKGIIADLDEAIATIGSETATGVGPELLTTNDLFFNGDMQSWKKLANSLKLKLALRAHGAVGEDFSVATATAAIAGGVLGDKDAVLTSDNEISTWSSASYGDIWHPFYGGGHWNVGSTLIDVLRDNKDPRLMKFANPVKGGTFVLTKPTTGSNVALYPKHVKHLTDHIKAGGLTITETTASDGTVTITVPAGVAATFEHYVGQPTRMNSKIKPYLYTNLFSKPTDYIIGAKNTGNPIAPKLVMTAAESHLMVAEAAIKGIGSGANTHYQMGITKSMQQWGVSASDIATFLANESVATLSGTTAEKLAQVATQRWIAHYTDGLEAWAVVRDSGVPVLPGVGTALTDQDIYVLGDLNGVYPQRMRYGGSAYNKNEANVNAANAIQGSDLQATKLWWAK